MSDIANETTKSASFSLNVPKFPNRSIGLKFLLVCFLTLIMSIPMLFVNDLVQERARHANDVANELGAQSGGAQSVSGPILIVPYEKALKNAQTKESDTRIERGYWAFFASSGKADANMNVSTRVRSLYKVPTYVADLNFDAEFDLSSATSGIPNDVSLNWKGAQLMAWVSDLRGVKDNVVVTFNGTNPRTFTPTNDNILNGIMRQAIRNDAGLTASEAAEAATMAATGGSNFTAAQAIVTNVGDLMQPNSKTKLNMKLKVSGADRLSLPAFAQDTSATIKGNWASPKFEGAFLADKRHAGQEHWDEVGKKTIVKGEENSFSANWRAPFLARGLPNAGPIGSGVDITSLATKDFAVSLIQRSEVYNGVGRALRYCLLFVGSVFLAYFLFEATGGVRAHAAQYLLVGLAQAMFYLLLLAFAEQIGFGLAFLIAATATVLLSGLYAGAVFKSRLRGIHAIGAFGVIYALMYILMTLEDQALLAGSLVGFAAIAAAMYLTRNIDWYGDRIAQADKSEAT